MKTNEITNELLENYSEQILALAIYLDAEPDKITDEAYSRYSYGSKEYLIVTDSEADNLWEIELDNYLTDVVYDELPKHLVNYFDDEKWKQDARYDGRAHSLSFYDGNEYEETVNGNVYYIYRQN